MAGQIFVGTSGWSYKHWVGVFYPPDLPPARYLAYYAGHFDTVEVNYSFYRLPSHEAFAAWRQETTAGFVLAVKASRYLTHMRKLKEPAGPLGRLLEAAAGLEEKFGPLLFQFPAQWGKNLPRLAGLLAILPAGRRCAFEFRHPSWLGEDVYAALARYGCALCIPDHPALPQALRRTADFTYLRFHSGRYCADYSAAELAHWAERLRGFLTAGVDVYAYFNNDVAGYAVQNAAALRSLLRQAS